ncbi:10415_t:CDS:2 [Funneliformis caledonium]|uniref:10415_t:CDS:1 n=1 Tax=Funneliformis caledonium TaxID=1117310 RepID=A0A9N8V5L3_9GLOM|nr:10415_t:CDS:2 [Funneliformis caledonium]
MNAPDRFDVFYLPPGSQKMKITPDTKVQNAATFEILREDHTMGNVIRHKLLQEPQVIFAGYKVPHPLEHNVIIRVQTTNETKPEAMVAKALNDLITEVGYLRTKFMEDLGRARALVIPREQKSMIEQEPQIMQGIQQPTREPANTSVGNTGGVVRKEALALSVEYLRIFTVQAVIRATNEVKDEVGGSLIRLEVTHLEKIAPQLSRDF